MAAKIAVGLRLDEITNAVTQQDDRRFEPALDYCVVKIPRWPFDKFACADRTIGTQMKATGEVMAIDRTFEAALQKAVRSLEQGRRRPRSGRTLLDGRDSEAAKSASARADSTPERSAPLGADGRPAAEATSEEIYSQRSGIDPWFLRKLANIVSHGATVAAASTMTRARMLWQPSGSASPTARSPRLPACLPTRSAHCGSRRRD